MVLHTVALAAAVADSVQAGDGCLGTGQNAVLTVSADSSMLAQAAGGVAAGNGRSCEEGRILDLEVHHGCVCAPVGVVTGIAHLVPVLHFVQEALLCVTLIAHDVGQLFQSVGSIQGGGVVAVAGKCLHGEAVGAGLVVGHILADLLQHVLVAAIHGLMVVGLILAVSIPVGVGDADHLLAFRHHIQIAHGAVAGDGLIEETLAVVAKDGPDAAEGEGRTAVDAGCLTCTGACLHGSACPHHHTDAGAITAHGRNVVHIGAVLAVRPCQIAQGIAQVQTHVRVASKVAC